MLVGLLLVTRGGSLLKHALGVLLLAWRRIILAGAAAGIAGILLGEIGAVIVTGDIPPPAMAHVVVVIFAFVVTYCTALTVFIDEILHGILNTIRMLEGDITAGARAAAVIAEREAGDVGSGIMRLFGRGSSSNKSGSGTTARAFVAPTVETTRSSEAEQTAADFDATEEFLTTSPRSRVDARPVPAGQLPRIGWAASGPQSMPLEDPAGPTDDDSNAFGLALPDAPPLLPGELDSEPLTPTIPAPVAAAPAVQAPDLPPAPAVDPTPMPNPVGATTDAPVINDEPPTEVTLPFAQVAPAEAVAADPTPADTNPAGAISSLGDTKPANPIRTTPADGDTTSIAATPTTEPQGNQWTPPSAVNVLPPSAAPDEADTPGYGEAARPTRPLSRPNRPVESGPNNSSSGRGIWSRISQALVGTTNGPDTPESPDAPEAPASDAGAPQA